jgi:hypothetical protein
MNEEDIQRLFNSQIFGCETSPRHLDLWLGPHGDSWSPRCLFRKGCWAPTSTPACHANQSGLHKRIKLFLAVFEGREIVFSWLCEAMQGHTIMLLAAALLGAVVWLSALHPDFWHHQGQQTCPDDGNSG